jgi:hypothetical protein
LITSNPWVGDWPPPKRVNLVTTNLAVHFDKRTILYRKVLDKEPTLTVHP